VIREVSFVATFRVNTEHVVNVSGRIIAVRQGFAEL
jgi:hypothetical protein